MFARKIGKKIQEVRTEKRLTQEKLSEKASLSATYLGFIEQGRKEPKFKTLKRIADALNVKVKDLITF